MSKVKIQGNATGSGIFTVAAPATNTDRTLTLPDVDATVLTTAGGNFNANIGIALDGFPALKFRNAAGTDKAEIYVGTSFGDLNVVVNSQAAITVDSSARVRMPYQPAFKVGLQDGTLNGGSILNSSTVSEKTGRDEFNRGGHYNHSTGRFTAPVTGVYYFCIQWMRQGTSAGRPALRFGKNGNNTNMWARHYAGAYTSDYETGQLMTTTTLQANDYVVVHATDGSVSFYGDDSYFFGYLIG